MSGSDLNKRISEILKSAIRRPEEEPPPRPEDWGADVYKHGVGENYPQAEKKQTAELKSREELGITPIEGLLDEQGVELLDPPHNGIDQQPAPDTQGGALGHSPTDRDGVGQTIEDPIIDEPKMTPEQEAQLERERLRLAQRRQARQAARRKKDKKQKRRPRSKLRIAIKLPKKKRLPSEVESHVVSKNPDRAKRFLTRLSTALRAMPQRARGLLAPLTARRQARQVQKWRETNRQLVGLDIGSAMIKAVLLSPDAAATIYQRPLPPGVIVNGLVEEPERLTNALQQLWKEAGIKSKKVNLGIKNRSLRLRVQETAARQEKDIRQVVALSSKRAFAPADPRQLIIDYCQLSRSGDKNRLLVAAADLQSTRKIVRAVEKAGLFPVCCEPIPLAEQRSLVSPRYPQGLHLLVDIGAESTSLLFCSGPDAYYLRVIEIAGNDFTEALIADKNMTWLQGEEQKKNQDLISGQRSSEAVSNLADKLINEIEKTVQEAEKVTGRKVQSWAALGDGARLPGLLQRIEDFSTLPSRQDLRPHPDIGTDNLSSYAAVLGLSSGHQMSLLPPPEAGRLGKLPALGALRRQSKVRISQSQRQGRRLALGDGLLAGIDPRLPALALSALIALGAWLLANGSRGQADSWRQQIAANKARALAAENSSARPIVYVNSRPGSELAEIIASRPAGNSVQQSVARLQQTGVQDIRLALRGAQIIITGQVGSIQLNPTELQLGLSTIPGVSQSQVSENQGAVKATIDAQGLIKEGQ